MKKTMTLVAAGAIAVSSIAPAFAGSVSAPVVEAEPVVIVEEGNSSSVSPWILIVLGLAAAYAISENN